MMCVQVVGFAVFAAAPGMGTLVVAAVCYGVSVGSTSPFLKALTAKATAKQHWGVENGQLNFYGDLGKALGAGVGGVIIDATSKAAIPAIACGMAVFCAAVCGVCVAALALMQRKTN
jgi:MFS family permease